MVKTFPCLLVVEVKGLQLHWQRKEQVKFMWNTGLSSWVYVAKNTAANVVFKTLHNQAL
jgi:hypothetical protein